MDKLQASSFAMMNIKLMSIRKFLLGLAILAIVLKMLTYVLSGSLSMKADIISDKSTATLEQEVAHFSTYINRLNATKEKTYITNPKYTPRLKPKYFTDNLQSTYQFTTYMAAGEIARRYQAKYIIDVGCGAGTKLAAFHNEFYMIGIDYKDNLEKVKKNYPFIKVIEINLDQESGCIIDIDSSILSHSVIISADVIEHLVDPFRCFMKIMKKLAKESLALVLSTPDRKQFVKIGMYKDGSSTIPKNPTHVREWLLEELEIMFMDQGMFPVRGGWECYMFGKCNNGIKSMHSTSVLIFANTQIRKLWMQQPQLEINVYAYMILHEGIDEKMLEFNLDYLQQQGIKVTLVAVKPWTPKNNRKLEITYVINEKEIEYLIESTVNKSLFKPDDWIIVLSANEIISFPKYFIWNYSLHDALVHIGREPYGFNAVGLSIFFMQDLSGRNFTRIPFKMFSLQPWTNGGKRLLDNLKPTTDTLKNRVHIWKHGTFPYSVNLTMCETVLNYSVPCDVSFDGKNVYPFHAHSLRFHPGCDKPYVDMSSELQKNYVLESSLGYCESNKSNIMTSDFLY